MAEKVSKPKAPAKPKKAAAKSTTDAAEIPAQTVASSTTAAPSKAKKSSKTTAPVDHSDVAQLAHSYFTQRGHKHGHHEDDWFRAEQELRGKAS